MLNNILSGTIDRAIGLFNPAAQLKRMQYRAAINWYGGNEYDGAIDTANYETTSWESTPDDDIADLDTLRPTSRKKYKNNGFYKGIIQCATDHTIGSGLRAKSTIKRNSIPNTTDEQLKILEDNFDEYFNDWASSNICDTTGKDNFFLQQRLAYKTYLKDGDCFAALPIRTLRDTKVLQVKLLGSENIEGGGDDFVEGIKTSKDKLPLKYSIKQNDNEYKIVNAFSNGKRNILHLFQRERIEQLRGVPFLTPVMRNIDAIDQYMKYEINAAKLSSIFYGSIETATNDDIFSSEEIDLTTATKKQTVKNTIKENTITQLQQGDKLNIHNQGRDNPNFEQFISTELSAVSTETRIPLEIMKAQFVSSYSASRAAMLQMEKFTKPERMLMVDSFCKPTRNQVIIHGVLKGELQVPNNFFEFMHKYLKAVWIGDPMGSVDPIKDIKAKIMAIENNLGTREQVVSELGFGDFESNVNILEKEKDLLIKKGLLIIEREDSNGN